MTLPPAMALDAATVVNGVAGLPSLPANALEVIHTLDDEAADTAAIVRKIAGDQALVTRLLRVANSSFYGLSGRVNSIQDALVVLGLRSVRMLAMAATLGRDLGGMAAPGFAFRSFWRNSVGTAIGARILARRLHLNEESAFVAGLLHDIGQLALATCFPNHFAAVEAYRQQFDCHFVDAERAILNLDHALVGKLLAERWQFPSHLCDAIGLHHGPDHGESSGLAAVVHVADAMVHALDLVGDATDMVPRIVPAYWKAVGFSWHDSQVVLQDLEDQFTGMGDLLTD